MLVGIIVLVFAGVFFSLLADKRFSFSKSQNSMAGLISEEKVELDGIRHELEKARERWISDYEPRLGQGDSLAKLSGESKSCGHRIEELQEVKNTITTEVEALKDRHDDYQGRYRQQIRTDAMGEVVAELKSTDGRIFKNATIGKVTAAGIEIRHEGGSLRLLPEDLDASWHERFQWSRDEVALHLEGERVQAQRHSDFVDRSRISAATPVIQNPKKKEKEQQAAQENATLQLARQSVIDTRRKMNQARSDASRARSEARSSRGRSVPGSLETWAERAASLDAAAAKYQAQYMAARGRLATIAPNDPQLQVFDE